MGGRRGIEDVTRDRRVLGRGQRVARLVGDGAGGDGARGRDREVGEIGRERLAQGVTRLVQVRADGDVAPR